MNYYEQIKTELINNEVYKKVKNYSRNRNELQTYYNIDKLLIEAQGGEDRAKYGNGLIKEYSNKLTNELGKGYSIANLKKMRSFYLLSEKGLTLSSQLTWSHFVELLSIENSNKLEYYMRICQSKSLSVRQLREKIKNKEYERLPDKTKSKLINNEENKIEDFIKNPIIIKNVDKTNKITEYALKQAILENMDSFLTELGDGFCYIKNEYPIKIGNQNNYIDLLLFNIEYNCYVVIELKVTELKKEHLGQIQVYMNYIDQNVKKIHHDKTIGIIICKEDNKFILKYCSDNRIFSAKYITV